MASIQRDFFAFGGLIAQPQIGGTLALAARLRYLQAYEFFLADTGGLLHGLYI